MSTPEHTDAFLQQLLALDPDLSDALRNASDLPGLASCIAHSAQRHHLPIDRQQLHASLQAWIAAASTANASSSTDFQDADLANVAGGVDPTADPGWTGSRIGVPGLNTTDVLPDLTTFLPSGRSSGRGAG